jgi:hypothetical protein
MSMASGRSVGEVYGSMSEAEARLLFAYCSKEPTDGERLDYWFSGLTAAYFTAHRRQGDPATKPASLIPEWGWSEGEGEKADKQQKAVTDWKDFARAMAKVSAEKKRLKALAQEQKGK